MILTERRLTRQSSQGSVVCHSQTDNERGPCADLTDRGMDFVSPQALKGAKKDPSGKSALLMEMKRTKSEC